MQPSIQTHHANCLCFNFGANMCKHKEALAHIDSKDLKGASGWPRKGHFGGQFRSESFALARMNSWLEALVPCSTRVASRRAVGVLVQTTRSLAGAAVLAQTWKWIIMVGWIKCLPCLIPHLALRQGVFWFLANNKCNPSCLTPGKLRISSWRFHCSTFLWQPPGWIHFLPSLSVFWGSAHFLGVSMDMSTFWGSNPFYTFVSIKLLEKSTKLQ